jgi:ATP-binding cassette subfamily C protein CydD
VLGYDWLSALIFAVTAPLIPLFMVLIGKAVSNLTEKQWNALSRMSAVYLELLQALNMLKVFNRSRQQVHFITAVGEEHEQATMKVLRVAFLSALSLELLSTISTAVVAVGVGLRLLYGFMEFEDALFVLFLAPELYLPLRQLGSKFHSATNGVSAANRIFDVLSKPSPMYQGDAVPYEPLEKICFRQVNFSFHQNTRATLKDISFEMKPRQLTALVGPSGAGKSTLTAILLGFLQPSSGEVTYNDIPLSKLDMEWWRSKVSWVAQSPYLFDGTIIENIRLAVPQASLQEIINAAELAHAHEFIQSMPQGYETIVGERGVRLSVGEAQRLALARAFLKKDSFLLVVDEPTSALDVESEQYIQEALSRLAKERSVLVLAHRLATVVKADQIIVLSNGSVVQRGTHEKLLEEEGVYRELVNASSHAEVLMEEPTLDSLGLDTEQYHADSTQLNIPLSLNFEEKSDTSTGLWVRITA